MRISDWSSDVCSSDLDHEIVPVINKIDLPAADVDKVKAEIEDIIGLPADDAVLASAKAGIGIEEALEAIVTRIPPPKGDAAAPLIAMLVDSRSEEHTSELQSLMRISYAVFCLKKKTNQ